MKIIPALIFILVFSVSMAYAQTPNCDYQRTDDGTFKGITVSSSKDEISASFRSAYALNVCESFLVIDKDAEKYVQGIKKTEGKKIVELMHDIGDMLCRGFFGSCGENEDSLYNRYRQACEDSRAKTLKESPQEFVTTDTPLLIASFANDCENLAATKMKIYKQAADVDAAKYVSQIVEKSNMTYLEKSHDMVNTLFDKMNTVTKMFGDISRAFEGFTVRAFNGGKK